MNFAHTLPIGGVRICIRSGEACSHCCSRIFSRHDLSGLVGWRWRSLRHAFSSVGSERGVPIEVQTVFHGMGKGGASRDFHACSKFGRLGEV